MGYPENPIEDDNQVVRPPSNIVILDDDLDVNNDSDDEENAYNGYQPLGMLDDDNMSDMDHVATIKLDEDDNDDNLGYNVTAVEEDRIQTIDSELEREVWSAPRPEHNSIHLDESRTAQIMSLMTKINLPEHSIPQWAREISDEKWKEELLTRVRQQKTT